MATKILIVDDNPMNLKLAQLLVSSEGYEALTADDAYDALSLLQDTRPDLILMDLQMPGMDGLELTRRLKADPETRDIPVIALTAAAMYQDERRAADAGCDGFMRKPLDTRTFAAALAGHLEGRAVT
jgi:CheY-like chemotaxis protein